MTTIRTSEWRSQPEASLRKIQSVADAPAHPVKRHPSHILLTNASLQHQVFDKTSNRIVGEGGYDRRVHPKAASQAAGDVVFAATLPHAKMTRRGDALVPRVEAQHDFTEADQVPHATTLRFDLQLRHDLKK
jgi:hypothetical protein